MFKKVLTAIVIIVMIGLVASCYGTSTGSPTPTTTYSRYQLAYFLIDKYPDYFWCDPDFYPVPREGGEEKNAQEQFPFIRANRPEFSAILEKLGLPEMADYSDAEKLEIYREHKKLTQGLELIPDGNNYKFTLRTGEGQGYRIEGTVTASGLITETKREPSINTCPICLVKGTLIDTPRGEIAVELIEPGMEVWTLDKDGNKIAKPVNTVSKTPVTASHIVVRISLSDGRSITASPGHPSAEGRPLGAYKTGDTLDRAVVTGQEYFYYYGGETFDILPGGETGLYRANGVLLKSTLKRIFRETKTSKVNVSAYPIE